MRLHKDELPIAEPLVRELLADQFPKWANLPLKRLTTAGTDNIIYRLGERLVIRLPRIHWAERQVAKEWKWMPRLAQQLPLALPKPLAMGEPSEQYPWNWGIYQWVEGKNAALDEIHDPVEAAEQLAHFLLTLQALDTVDGPAAADENPRGLPLVHRDAPTRQAIHELGDLIDLDVDAALQIWDAALAAPEWSAAPVYFHGDLLPGNVLFKDGRLHAVIDWNGLAVGDPACDMMIAWGLFAGESRAAFRRVLGENDATWARGRGHSLSQAAMFVPYYIDTNPIGVAYARHMLAAVLADGV